MVRWVILLDGFFAVLANIEIRAIPAFIPNTNNGGAMANVA